MNPDELIAKALSDDFENDIAQYGALPDHRFSWKFRRKIRKLLAPDTKAVSLSAPRLPLRKSVRLALIVLVTALITGAVFAYYSRSFRGTVYSDNTHLFAVDVNDCPKTIEKEYALSVVPDGYELYEVVSDEEIVYIVYMNADGEELIFIQTVKAKFNSHINTENNTLHEHSINGCDAVSIEFDGGESLSSIVIWNNSKYILTLDGECPEDELISLAESNEMHGFE